MKKFEVCLPLDIYQEHRNFFHSVFDKHCSKWCTNEHHVFTNSVGDEVSKFAHQHLGGWLTSDNTPETVSKWFNNDFGFVLKPNNIEKIKGQWSTYCLYIGLHYNQDDKEPITLDTTHFYASDGTQLKDLVQFAQDHIRVDVILDQIANGQIKEYEIVRKLGATWYRKNFKNVDTALKVYQKSVLKGENFSMKTIMWVYGATGTGKTTLATHSLNEHKDFFLASDSNPLDDYKGEPVLILDDISDNTLTSKALLKLLDPNYTCPAGARYYNKMVVSDTIIVCSTISPKQWWINQRQVYKNNGGYEQLLRRLNGGVYNIISSSDMEFSVYDDHGNENFTVIVKLPDEVRNLVTSGAKTTLEDKASKLMKRFNLTLSEQ